MKSKKFSKKVLLFSLIVILIISLFALIVLAQVTSDDTIRLYKGWNLISVTPAMVGKNLTSISKTSDASKVCVNDGTYGWLYAAQLQRWVRVQPIDSEFPDRTIDMFNFDQGSVGFGMWLKVKNDCTLGCGITSCQSSVPTPPSP